MLRVLYTSGRGQTVGVLAIVRLMEDHFDNLLGVLRVRRHEEDTLDTFVYIAIFQEQDSLGNFVAFINEGGTSWGKTAGGEGSRGHALIESFIEDKEVDVLEVKWKEIDSKVKGELENRISAYARSEIWKEFIFNEYLYGYSYFVWPHKTKHTINDRWNEMLKEIGKDRM